MYVGKREKFYQITKRSSNLGESEGKSIFIYAEKDKMSAFNDALVMLKDHLMEHKYIYEYDGKTIDELIESNISSSQRSILQMPFQNNIQGLKVAKTVAGESNNLISLNNLQSLQMLQK